MRVEPAGVGSFVHVVQRGGHNTNIVRDTADRYRFVRSLYYLNDTYADPMWHRTVANVPAFERPTYWPERDPLVRILAWTLLSNHFHLLLQETREGGVAKFMQRLCGSVTVCFNKKYNERGRLFQSSYHSRIVASDSHFNYLVFYILVKNTLDMFPGGIETAYSHFDSAWEWAGKYPFSSLQDVLTGTPGSVTDDQERLVETIIGPRDAFKREARELLAFHMGTRGEAFSELMLEPW